MEADSVGRNYSDVGTIVMESIYGDNFLSPGGVEASAALAAFADMTPGQQVLDVGSGLGGAAFYLAKQLNCEVQGIELMAGNVAEATARARQHRLESRVRFITGNAISLPWPAASFDVVWGQDAWCHIDARDTLLAGIACVLRPGGHIVFSDWLLRDARGTDSDAIRDVTASPQMGTADAYRALLVSNGFELKRHADLSEVTLERYRKVMHQLQEISPRLRSRFGDRVIDIVTDKQSFVMECFERGSLTVNAFVAKARVAG